MTTPLYTVISKSGEETIVNHVNCPAKLAVGLEMSAMIDDELEYRDVYHHRKKLGRRIGRDENEPLNGEIISYNPSVKTLEGITT